MLKFPEVIFGMVLYMYLYAHVVNLKSYFFACKALSRVMYAVCKIL